MMGQGHTDQISLERRLEPELSIEKSCLFYFLEQEQLKSCTRLNGISILMEEV